MYHTLVYILTPILKNFKQTLFDGINKKTVDTKYANFRLNACMAVLMSMKRMLKTQLGTSKTYLNHALTSVLQNQPQQLLNISSKM